MTREEILAMDSTELRIEVAEKIFHAKVIGKDGSNPPEFLLVGDKGAGWFPLSGKRWQNTDWHFLEEAAWNDCPEYAESISASWEVVEKIGSKKEWMLYRLGHTDEDGILKYECIFLQVFSGFSAAAKALTAPEAICKAALLAVMEGKDEES